MTQPNNFSDWSSALRTRDVVAKIVREEMNRQRPPARYGKVVSFNRFSLNAKVLFPGDVETTTVKFPLSLQPTRSVDLFGDQAADVVRVEGVPSNLWITEIVNGPTQHDQSRFSHPKLMGGVFLHEQRASWFSTGTGELPTEGGAWYAGRWTNEASFGADGLTNIDIVVQQTILCSIVKRYSIAVKSNDTGDAWEKVVPSQDSGPWSNNDFELEMKTSSTSIEFRVRRTSSNSGGFTPGGYDLDVWFYGKEWDKDFSVPESLTTDAAPTAVAGTASVNEGKGPFVSPGLHAPQLAQHLVIGGGAVNYVPSFGQLKWTSRFIVIGLSKNHLSPGGYFDIPVPLGGVTIPVYTWSGGFQTQTVAGGIYLANWQALYYEIPWGSTGAGVEANFRIVSHDGPATSPFQVPSHWVLLAVKGGDTALPWIKLASGEIIHYSVGLPLGANVAAAGGAFFPPGYRRVQGGRGALEGVAKATAALAVGAVIGTLPSNFKPGAVMRFVAKTDTGFGGVDVQANGNVVLNAALALNATISLDGITFPLVQ